MKIFSSLHLLAAMGVIGMAGAASAQQVDTSQWKCSSCPYPKGTTGTVDGGAGYVSDSSQKFGDYTGLDKKGGFLVLDGSVSRRGDDGYYADVTAADLGLDNRRISGEAGREGLYSLNVGYAEIPRHLTQDARTPFLGSGGSVLTLPGGFPAGDTASMPLGTTLQPVDIGYKYKRFDLGGTFLAGQDWNARLTFRHDERDGTKPTSGSFFSNASQFLAPVNEKTDQIELAFNYATRKVQASASYEFSSFHNDNAGLTWSNPFLPTIPGATTGQLALAPSNDFQQLRGTLGYDISPTIRVSGNAAWGRMTQKESFLPPTQNALLAPTVPALPVTSLGGKVDTFNGGIKATALVMEGLRLTGTYDRDVHDNRTPVNAYPIVTTDMFVQPGTRNNTPFSWTIDRFKFLGDYSGGLPASMRITGGLEYDRRDRSYQEVQSTREWTVWGKVAAQPLENMSTSLRLDYAWRDNTVYGTQVWFPFVENPLLRKFNLADRKRTKLEGRFDYLINDKVTLGVTADYSNDDYNSTDIGLTSLKTASLATELAFAISEKTQARGFLQGQWARAEQHGSQAFGTPDWFGRVKDQFTMLGVGVKHVATEKLDIGADLTIARSHSDTAVDFVTGTPAFPTATTKMDSVKLYGVYKLKDNMSIVGSYEYQHYASDDWIFQGIAPGTVPNLLALGIQPPNYSVNVFRVALRYRF